MVGWHYLLTRIVTGFTRMLYRWLGVSNNMEDDRLLILANTYDQHPYLLPDSGLHSIPIGSHPGDDEHGTLRSLLGRFPRLTVKRLRQHSIGVLCSIKETNVLVDHRVLHKRIKPKMYPTANSISHNYGPIRRYSSSDVCWVDSLLGKGEVEHVLSKRVKS